MGGRADSDGIGDPANRCLRLAVPSTRSLPGAPVKSKNAGDLVGNEARKSDALFCVCRPIMDGACILCVPKTRFGNIGGEVHRVRAAPRRRQSARSADEWECPCPVIDASSTCCSSARMTAGSGANAPRRRRSHDRCTRAGSTRSGVQHGRSAMASGMKWADPVCPSPGYGV